MKLTYLLLVLVVVFFIGCTSSPAVIELETTEQISTAAVDVAQEVKKEPVKIVTTVFFPIKKDIYFGDGTKDEYRIFTYDEKGIFLLREDLYSSDEKLSEYSEYEYKGSDFFIKRNYDSAGNLVSYTDDNTDSDGNIIRVENYNSKDQLQSRSDYEYKDGLKIKWRVYGSSLNLLSETFYRYTDGKLTRIESVNSGGDLEEYFLLNYNSKGLVEKNTHYSASDEVEGSISYEYEDGYLTVEKFHRKNGSVKRKIMYINDKNGNPVEIVYMDAGNNVSERVIIAYESREEISYEN